MRCTSFVPSGHCTLPNLMNTPSYSSVRDPVPPHMSLEALTSTTVSFLSIIPLAKVGIRSTPLRSLIVHRVPLRSYWPSPQMNCQFEWVRHWPDCSTLLWCVLHFASFSSVGSPKVVFACRATRECSVNVGCDFTLITSSTCIVSNALSVELIVAVRNTGYTCPLFGY